MVQAPSASGGPSGAEAIKWAAVGAGSLLVVAGARSGGVGGVALAAAGASLAYAAATGRLPGARRAADSGIRVEKAVTVSAAPERLYGFWRQVENLPRFMSHLESVTETGGQRSHWVAKAPAGLKVEWDAEVTEDLPGRRIAWRSLEGSQVPNEGEVDFRPAPGDRGTEVRVSLRYRSPAGALGAAVARLFGQEPGQQVEDDLRRFKRLIEVGLEPTTEGQPSGRSVARAATAPLYDNRRTG